MNYFHEHLGEFCAGISSCRFETMEDCVYFFEKYKECVDSSLDVDYVSNVVYKGCTFEGKAVILRNGKSLQFTQADRSSVLYKANLFIVDLI